MLSRCQSLTFKYFHREGEEGGSLFLQTRWPYGINKRQFSKVCLLNIGYNMPLWSLCTAEKCDPATKLMSTGNAAQTGDEPVPVIGFFFFFTPAADGLSGRLAPWAGCSAAPAETPRYCPCPQAWNIGVCPKGPARFWGEGALPGNMGQKLCFFLSTTPDFSIWSVMMFFWGLRVLPLLPPTSRKPVQKAGSTLRCM